MPIPTSFSDLSETASYNSPQGSEPVGTNANEYFQAAFAFIAQLHGGFTPVGTLTAPAGTRLVMQQSAAPAGWTVDASSQFSDCSMRFDQTAGTSSTGSGWSSIGTGAAYATTSTTLTLSQIPSHSHGVTDGGHTHGLTLSDPGHAHAVGDPGHSHSSVYGNFYNTGGSNVGWVNTFPSGSGNSIYQTAGTAASATGIEVKASASNISGSVQASAAGISIQSNGGGTGHAHSVSLPTLKYASCIVAIKS